MRRIFVSALHSCGSSHQSFTRSVNRVSSVFLSGAGEKRLLASWGTEEGHLVVVLQMRESHTHLPSCAFFSCFFADTGSREISILYDYYCCIWPPLATPPCAQSGVCLAGVVEKPGCDTQRTRQAPCLNSLLPCWQTNSYGCIFQHNFEFVSPLARAQALRPLCRCSAI